MVATITTVFSVCRQKSADAKSTLNGSNDGTFCVGLLHFWSASPFDIDISTQRSVYWICWRLHVRRSGVTNTGDSWGIKNQLDVTCYFYFTYYLLNMFRTSICPSSGACDCVDGLPHRLSSSLFVVCWGLLRMMFGGVRFAGGNPSTQSQAPEDRHINVRNMLTNNKWNKNNKWHQVGFNSSPITMMHGPINSRLTESVCDLSCVTTHLLQHSTIFTTWLYYLRSLLFSVTGVILDFVFGLSWAALSESFTLWLFATQNIQEKL